MVDWRSALLRRLARRFHIGDDILRHLSTFQRLGERFDIEPPQEMLPVGARTIVRALRTRSAAQIRPDWLWPYWLERQLDPNSPAFVPRGHLPFASNVTHRNWTAVGNPAAAWEAIVDPTGLVTPGHDTWSVDWWVRVGDRWILPSRDTRLSQRLDSAIPVVRTVIATGPGEVEQIVYATTIAGDEHVVIRVDNRTGDVAEIAFAVRPYNPEGLAVVQDIEVVGDRVVVDGDIALRLPSPPGRIELSTYRHGDSLHAVRMPAATRRSQLRANDPAGLAQGAVTYLVPSGDSVAVAVPLPPVPVEESPAGRVTPAASSLERTRGTWQRLLDRGMRVRLPDDRLQEAVDANRAYLLLLHDPGDITAGPATYHRFWFRDAAYQLAALDRWGLHAEAEDVLDTYPDRQRHDGFFYSQWREWDANGAALYAIAEHHRLTGDDRFLERLLPAVRAGVNWIGHTRAGRGPAGRRIARNVPELEGLLPAGVSAEHLGPFDYYYWDDFWCLRGLHDGAYLAHVAGEQDAARRIEAEATAFRGAIMRSIQWAASRSGRTLIPAGPYRGVDAGMVGSLVACAPLGLLPADDPWIAGTLETIRENFTIGDAFFQGISHTGFGTYLTLQLAFVELEAGDPRAWARLRWLLDMATPTFTWPEAIHPQLRGGCMGDGHHGWAAADFLNFVRQVLVRELSDGSIAVLGLLPDEWVGEEVEVRDAPTHAGKLSYRLTWEDERPLLDWRWEGQGAPLEAPGIDADWSTSEREGRAVLAARS